MMDAGTDSIGARRLEGETTSITTKHVWPLQKTQPNTLPITQHQKTYKNQPSKKRNNTMSHTTSSEIWKFQFVF